MDKQEFLNLIKSPDKFSPSDLEKLEEVVGNFPYCQTAHVLIAKIAHSKGSMLANQKLSKAAAYTTDRKNLKKLLVSEKKKYRESN
jgi:hypothetical protein